MKSQTINSKNLIVIAGPTAAGKTALAIEVARHFNTVILSADSRQCFKELDIGVARPSPGELAAVPHYFIASHSITEPINAAWYETWALQLLQQLFKEQDTAVLAGGTGLYIKALLEGLDAIPQTDPDIRTTISQQYQAEGMSWLQQALQNEDPLFAVKGEMQNPQRMMRALEVVRSTGKSVLNFRNREKPTRPFNTVRVCLDLPRAVLYERINHRVDAMVDAGLEQEALQLLPYRHLNALQTVGYKEMFAYFDGHISRETALDLIKQNTRHYAKRQLTWFKKQAGMQWIDLQQTPGIIPLIESLMI